MGRRFELRKQAMLAECVVASEVFRGAWERLETFVEPFAELLTQRAQREHAQDYWAGLVSDLERKNVESIAYHHDQERRNLPHFIGAARWDHQTLMMELGRQVGEELGEADGVIVFDPSAFPKQGKRSVGVARQWCGRLGKVDNCQVAVYMGYISRKDHALVNTRLYLPEKWADDRRRRKAAGVPKEACFQTRHEQALEMLHEQGHLLPHAWIAGDDEMGRNASFRRDLHQRREQYLLAVPCDALIRDLEADPPPYQGRGAVPKLPFQRVDQWRDSLSKDAWTRVNVRDGEKGPLEVEVVARRVETKIDQRVMKYEETLVIVRCLDEEGATKYDFYLSDASRDTPAKQFARVALAAHRIEEAIKRSKSQAGLSDYEVRNWRGWHHHQVLSLIATWFLIRESHRGKKWTPAITVPQIREGIQARFYHYKARNRLPPLRISQRRQLGTVKLVQDHTRHDMDRVRDPADPNRCTGAAPEGQCLNVAEPGSDRCRVHGGRDKEAEQDKRLYLLTKAQRRMRLAQLSEHEQIKSLRDEIALARMLIEERFNKVRNDSDLIAAFGPINTALLTVERLVKSAHTIEQNLGALLSKPTVLALGQSISQIIVEELKGIDDYEAIVDRINHRIVEAIVAAGSTSADTH